MAWTYGGDPENSDRDLVRLLVGDTIEADPLIEDEFIALKLAAHSNETLAASKVARGIAAKFARHVDIGGEGLTRSNGQRYEHYIKLAEELEQDADREGKSAASSPIKWGGSVDAATEPTNIFSTAQLIEDGTIRD